MNDGRLLEIFERGSDEVEEMVPVEDILGPHHSYHFRVEAVCAHQGMSSEEMPHRLINT